MLPLIGHEVAELSRSRTRRRGRPWLVAVVVLGLFLAAVLFGGRA